MQQDKQAPQQKPTPKFVRVLATARGYHDGRMREPGDSFTVPAALLAPRPRFVTAPNGAKVQEGFYDPPSWFQEATVVEKRVTEVVAVDKDRTASEDLA